MDSLTPAWINSPLPTPSRPTHSERASSQLAAVLHVRYRKRSPHHLGKRDRHRTPHSRTNLGELPKTGTVAVVTEGVVVLGDGGAVLVVEPVATVVVVGVMVLKELRLGQTPQWPWQQRPTRRCPVNVNT